MLPSSSRTEILGRLEEPGLPIWKSVLKNLFYIFAVFTIAVFCLYVLEDSRIWKAGSLEQNKTYSYPIERIDHNNNRETRYLSRQEYYWLTFLEIVTMVGLPTMFIIGILLQWGLKIHIIPEDGGDTPRLE